jgi:hypothetical protein
MKNLIFPYHENLTTVQVICHMCLFVGDEACALRKDLLKPFRQKQRTDELRVFNYRLSRARRVIKIHLG